MTQDVEVTAGSRLHFGLFGIAVDPSARSGGVGVMVRRPALRVRVRVAERFQAEGAMIERSERVAQCIAQAFLDGRRPGVRVGVHEAPGLHMGLGVGTQHAMAVATGMLTLLGTRLPPIDELSAAVGRGRRSLVGSHGFARGGLIVDDGGSGHAPAYVFFPKDWRFVLIKEGASPGLAGKPELEAFHRLPPTAVELSQEIRRLALEQLAPAAALGRFEPFAEALYQYGEAAGRCFEEAQGGGFASPAIQRRIAWLRERGISGCGQSSWGPTVFAVTENADDAERLAESLYRDGVPQSAVQITESADSGAAIATPG